MKKKIICFLLFIIFISTIYSQTDDSIIRYLDSQFDIPYVDRVLQSALPFGLTSGAFWTGYFICHDSNKDLLLIESISMTSLTAIIPLISLFPSANSKIVQRIKNNELSLAIGLKKIKSNLTSERYTASILSICVGGLVGTTGFFWSQTDTSNQSSAGVFSFLGFTFIGSGLYSLFFETNQEKAINSFTEHLKVN
jgi:hypothetical protein